MGAGGAGDEIARLDPRTDMITPRTTAGDGGDFPGHGEQTEGYIHIRFGFAEEKHVLLPRTEQLLLRALRHDRKGGKKRARALFHSHIVGVVSEV